MKDGGKTPGAPGHADGKRRVNAKRADHAACPLTAEERALIEALPVPAAVLSNDGSVVCCNGALEKLTGFTSNELAGHLAHPWTLEGFSADAILSGTPGPFQASLKCKDGSSPAAQITSRPVKDQGHTRYHLLTFSGPGFAPGEPICELGPLQPLEVFAHFPEKLPAIVYRIDRSGKFVHARGLLPPPLGYREVDLAGHYIEELLSGNDLETARHAFQQALSGQAEEFELRTVTPDGVVRWVAGSCLPLYEGGEIAGVHGAWVDITKRKRIEAALQESEMKFSVLVENARDGIAIIREDGYCEYANRSLLDMLGYSMEELSHLHLHDILAAEFRDDLSQCEQPRQAGKEPDGLYERRLVCKDGSHKLVEVSLATIQVAGRTVLLAVARDTAPRRRIEQALREIEDRYRLLAENVEDGIWTTDLNLNMTFVSPSAKRQGGFAPDEDLGRSIINLLTPASLEYANKVLEERLELLRTRPQDTMRPWSLEVEISCKSGGTRWLEVKVGFLRDATGVPTGFLGITRDITERRQAEEKLRESEAMYSALIEQSQEGVALVENGIYTFVNRAMTDITGYPADELLGKPFVDLVEPERQEFLRDRYGLWMSGNHVSRTDEMVITCKDGTQKTVETAGWIIKYGGRTAIVGVMRDVTARKKHEVARWESEERLRLVFESVAEGITVTDLDGFVLDVNQRALEIFGVRDKDSLQGRSAFEFISPKSYGRAMELMPKTVALGAASRSEYMLRRADGTEFPGELSVSVMRDMSGTPIGFIAVTRDITARKEAEQALTSAYQAETQLRQELEREIRRRSEFLRGLIHEIKTPLTSMMVSSELLANHLRNKEQLQLARNLRRGTANLNRRIDELLDLARGELGVLRLERVWLKPGPLFVAVCDDMVPLASERKIDLVRNLPSNLPSVWVDADRLRQVVLNFLDNALKFTPEGGSISIRAWIDEGSLLVEIVDSGPGVAPEMVDRLFDPYYRTDSVRGSKSGLGLGLALSKTLVELHGGEVWVKSIPDQGGTFGFSIPLQPPIQSGQSQ